MADRLIKPTGQRLRTRPKRPLSRAEQVLKAFVREERFGIRLATYARFVATGIVGVWVVVQNWSEGAATIGYYLGVIATFAALGGAHLALSESRYRRPWHKFVFTVLDLCLLTYLIIASPPTWPNDMPSAMVLRLENFPYFFVFLGGAALTFSPSLVLVFGVAASLIWTAGVMWVMMQPDSFGFERLGRSVDSMETWLPIVLDPNFVSPDKFITQIIILLVASAIIALVVSRARRLVLRQVRIERERTNLARYFSPNMIDELARADEPFGTVRSQHAAVLFADLFAFTRLTETLSPAQAMDLLREFHSRMAEAVFDHGGTLDKYIGDEVMATFGTPRPGPRDAANALGCSLAMQEAIARWNRERAKAGEPAIRLGIGLHYGSVVLGNIGGEQRFEFTVIGDTVNVASRLERQSRGLDADIVVADPLVQQVRQELGTAADQLLSGFSAIPDHELRGRREAIDVWVLSVRRAAA
jgi:adenylate cyclase